MFCRPGQHYCCCSAHFAKGVDRDEGNTKRALPNEGQVIQTQQSGINVNVLRWDAHACCFDHNSSHFCVYVPASAHHLIHGCSLFGLLDLYISKSGENRRTTIITITPLVRWCGRQGRKLVVCWPLFVQIMYLGSNRIVFYAQKNL